MKRFLTCFLLFAALLFCSVPLCVYALPGCGEGNWEDQRMHRINEALGVSLSSGTLVRYEDSHGGFHGDGLTAAEVDVKGLERDLAGAPGWKPLPMPENAARAVRLCGEEGASVKEGFYYLYDSQSDDPYDDTGLHSRYSWNFTAAVYDSGRGRLYFYKFDT